jgi:hypothetical protein
MNAWRGVRVDKQTAGERGKKIRPKNCQIKSDGRLCATFFNWARDTENKALIGLVSQRLFRGLQRSEESFSRGWKLSRHGERRPWPLAEEADQSFDVFDVLRRIRRDVRLEAVSGQSWGESHGDQALVLQDSSAGLFPT